MRLHLLLQQQPAKNHPMDVIGKTINFQIPCEQNHVAVALSGGGDSVALAYMVCQWATRCDRNVHVHLLTVNHNLRPEAADEATKVGQFVANFPCASHVILTWAHDTKPETAVMEQARQARYDLMSDYCRKNNIQTLCVAHHADDNLETFLFRLAKGSGLDGLSGMNQWSDKDEIQIYRPLLNLSHDDLISYCKNNGLKWIEDPSNENEKYARPRLRKALAAEGMDAKRFAKTLARLSRAHDALDAIANDAMALLCHSKTDNGASIDLEKMQTYPLDIQVRVVQKLIADIGRVAHGYPPKLERVEEIVERMQPNKSSTLHGCVLSVSKNGKTLEIIGS